MDGASHDEIAQVLRLSVSTVARQLRRCGLARLHQLEPAVPVVRYQWARPGDLLHLDVKKLGRIGRIGHRITGDRRSRVRGIGWEHVHVCVDRSPWMRCPTVPMRPNAFVSTWSSSPGRPRS